MIDPFAELPGYVLRRASVSMMEAFKARLAPIGLRYTESTVLLLIGANAGIRQSDLVTALAIQRANMTPLVARLVARGLVSKLRLDGRSQGLVLTDKGQDLCTTARTVVNAHEADVIAQIPLDMRDKVLPVLRALWQAAEEVSN